MRLSIVMLCVSCSCYLGIRQTAATAQQAVEAPVVIPYGTPIGLSEARRVLAAAEAEAVREHWPVAIAVVDPSGFLVAFARLYNTQLGSIEVAIEKARTSTLYRRATKEFDDRLIQVGANLKVLRLPGFPIEGAVPIVFDVKIVG